MHPLFRYAFVMNFKEIPLEEIDFDDEEFRISEDLDSAAILKSIREIGQLNPVLFLDRGSRKVIVCGFRRARAMKRLGNRSVLGRLLSSETHNPLQVFELAIWDNISHRQLNALEKARTLFKLKSIFGVSSDRLLKIYLPLLDLAPHESILNSHIMLDGARPGLRQCLAEGLLTHSSLESLAKTPGRIQDRVASLMTAIRLSASLQKKVLELLEDLSAMTDSPLDAPLDNPEVLAVSADSRLSPFQKGEKLHAILFNLRNPRLTQALERFAAGKKKLGLPGTIRISPHPFFETSNLHVEFDANNAESFRELTSALQKAAQLQDLEELFQPD
jgi:ParB-like chromosome segregation protein Spo0J